MIRGTPSEVLFSKRNLFAGNRIEIKLIFGGAQFPRICVLCVGEENEECFQKKIMTKNIKRRGAGSLFFCRFPIHDICLRRNSGFKVLIFVSYLCAGDGQKKKKNLFGKECTFSFSTECPFVRHINLM